MQSSNTIMGIFQFDRWTRQLFESIVRPLVETHTGLKYVDAASYYEPLTIKMDLISKMIMEARLVIVDISSKNPNVFIELGIAYSLHKPIVFLCSQTIWEGQTAEQWNQKLPFDLQGRELLIFRDENDLKVKLGRHISDSLYRTREVAPSWDSCCKDNHVKSSSDIEIFSPGRIWSASAVNSNFTINYRVRIHEVKQHDSNPDVRLYISTSPDGFPCIVIIFPWEYSEMDVNKYECHIDYFHGTTEGELTPQAEVFSPIAADNRYDGRCFPHLRLQQVSVGPRNINQIKKFDVFVSFYWPNLVFESTFFEEKINRLYVSLSSLRTRGYPIHISQYIGFESINSRVTIENIRLKEVFI
jgi:hypothetical protein